MIVFWGAATVVFLVIELISVGLTSIWFAIGALCALVTALLDAALWLQIVWFLLISVGTLVITRPLAKKYVNSRAQPTNADRVIGTEAVVRETVDNRAGTGTVFADGKLWTARSDGGEICPAGSSVRVLRIEGVKLIVDSGFNLDQNKPEPNRNSN